MILINGNLVIQGFEEVLVYNARKKLNAFEEGKTSWVDCGKGAILIYENIVFQGFEKVFFVD